jgi:hypothetical protein
MRGAVYYDFSVVVNAKQRDGLWVPDIQITSPVGKQSLHRLIHSACFTTRDEAEEHGLKMAREWIDRQYHVPSKH